MGSKKLSSVGTRSHRYTILAIIASLFFTSPVSAIWLADWSDKFNRTNAGEVRPGQTATLTVTATQNPGDLSKLLYATGYITYCILTSSSDNSAGVFNVWVYTDDLAYWTKLPDQLHGVNAPCHYHMPPGIYQYEIVTDVTEDGIIMARGEK